MTTTEAILKERIKELTCLYEVSSIIVNTDADQIPETFDAITKSLQKGFQFPEQTEIAIHTQLHIIATGATDHLKQLKAEIKVFNIPNGYIIAALHNAECSFLEEEQQLLDSVALKIGNLLERIEIQQNELQLRKQMQRTDRLSILGEITAGIAHELNTPLANILGFAELHKTELEAKGLEDGDVNKIIQNAIFAREVVKNLMFFTCAMPQEMQEIDIVPQLKSALELLDSTFKKKGVRYETQIAKDSIIIKADTIQFTQIIFNLIMNAIYFSPVAGKVTITVNEVHNHAVIKVIDQGIGLSHEALDKVFEPFFTTKPTGDGTGLGLSVVHGIVASHKGSITAENHINGGAIFTVKIPK